MLSPIKLYDSFWIDWVWVDRFRDQLRHGVLYPRWLPASHAASGALLLLLALIFRARPRRDAPC